MINLLRLLIASCFAGVPHNYGPIGHLRIPKFVWPQIVNGNGIVIDATCGNGYDSETLARLLQLDQPLLSNEQTVTKKLYCMDIQKGAIEKTKVRLRSFAHSSQLSNIHFIEGSHEFFPASILQNSVSLICYNLGYLPGAPRDENGGFIQTSKDTTKRSLQAAIPLLKENGLLSITSYPANNGGATEQNEVQDILSSLPQEDWRVYLHAPLNRPLSPHLYLAYRIGKSGKDVI